MGFDHKQEITLLCPPCREVSFDLSIAAIFYNNSCHQLNNKIVTLSYRLGAKSQWKILDIFISSGKLLLINESIYMYAYSKTFLGSASGQCMSIPCFKQFNRVVM